MVRDRRVRVVGVERLAVAASSRLRRLSSRCDHQGVGDGLQVRLFGDGRDA